MLYLWGAMLYLHQAIFASELKDDEDQAEFFTKLISRWIPNKSPHLYARLSGALISAQAKPATRPPLREPPIHACEDSKGLLFTVKLRLHLPHRQGWAALPEP